MTLDEKLDNFYATTIDNATSQSVEIISEFENSLKKIYEDHKSESLRKSETVLQIKTEELIREKNRKLSLDTLDIKRRISERNVELITILFDDINKKLLEYMKSNDYTLLLTKQILSAKEFADGELLVLYINRSDEPLKDMLEKQTGVTITISDIDFLGGTRALVRSKNILIDRSFQTKLLEEKEVFKFH